MQEKLLEKTSWYKKKRKRDDSESEEMEPNHRKIWKEKKGKPKEEVEGEARIKAVLFAPFTPIGELAKELRLAEVKLAELTGYKLKVVERAGTRLEDLLTKSDPWQGSDCLREKCLMCKTKAKTGKNKTQSCSKRSLVYEIWCQDCDEKEIVKIREEANGDEKLEKKLMGERQTYKYIGETSRSMFERALEHTSAMDSISSGSYMLKHSLDMHEEDKLETNRFGVRVLKFTKNII